MDAVGDAGELFGTETMAELCARQGRLEDARAIYRRLCARDGRDGRDVDDERRARWCARLSALEAQALAPPVAASAASAIFAPPIARGRVAVASSAPKAPATAAHTMPLVVREPLRSGQLVYAQATDLIVLAPVHAGAELMADGNIHVYGALRGRAIAGVRGAREARIFCQRLEAQLVGIDSAYLTADDIAQERFGKPSQVALEGERCHVMPL